MTNDNIYPFKKGDTIRDEARAWVIRFNQDEAPSPAEIDEFRRWVSTSSAHLVEIRRAEKLWCEADCLSELAVHELTQCSSDQERKQPAPIRLKTQSMIYSLATLLLIIPIYFAAKAQFNSDIQKNGSYATAIGQQSELILQDHSTVFLDTDSQIKIQYDDHTRKISLYKGKAYFKVAKNVQRPFEVHTSSGVIRAVGTAFTVSLTQPDIHVLVDEGIVDVARVKTETTPYNRHSDRGAGVTQPLAFTQLTQGDSLIFNDQTEVVSTLNTNELQKELAWQSGLLVFNGDPLSDVINEISRYTPITIQIADPFIRQRPIGGRFRIGEIHTLLNSLEIGFGIEVTYINENHVVLKSEVDRHIIAQ